MDTPPRLTTRSTWSGQRSRVTAARTPKATPMNSDRTMAKMASSKVAGTNSARSVLTGR